MACDWAEVLARTKAADNGCILWTGAVTSSGKGYGQVKWQGKARPVHRLLYEAFVGPVPENCELHHLCGNKTCCNRDQLSRTHCPSGHEYSEDNTYVDKKGTRHCRMCMSARNSKNWRKYYYGKKRCDD